MAAKRKGLGKGLDALLGDAFNQAKTDSTIATALPAKAPLQTVDDLQNVSAPTASESAESPFKNNAVSVQQIPVEMCQRGKYQPRKVIDSESLDELASSIRSQGVMQPIILRKQDSSEGQPQYEIIAGERRWRASQLAGLTTVPAIVRDVDDEAAIAMSLIENLQRDDLNPMEEAYALHRLQQEFELTHQQIADVVGKSRAAVSNALRLLGLHKDARIMLENGDLEMGHARAILALEETAQAKAARDVVNRALTVRETEKLVKNWGAKGDAARVKPAQQQDPNIARLQTDLSDKLGVPVTIKHKPNGAGQLLLKYNSLDELDGVLEHIH